MTESNHPKNSNTKSSWFDKLSHVLLGEPQDRSELVDLLRDAENRKLLNADALRMIEGVLNVSEGQVRDVMVPRSHMITIDIDSSPQDFLPTLIESGHSRFPVTGENKDEIVGILLAKELLKYGPNINAENFSFQELLRPAVFVPESKRLDALLKEFRQNRNHMAIVVDEYGGISGLVTIEDVLEEIVGNIEDEFDIQEDANIKKMSETTYTINALTPIDEFNDYFKTDISTEEFDTIGGIITRLFGHFPKPGEHLTLDNLEFTTVNADNRRIYNLQVTVLNNSTDEANNNSV